jgi:hypothetical protein
MQPSGQAFEGVRTPFNVQQIMMKTSGRQSNTVRTLGQSVTSSWISEVDIVWEVSASCPDDMATRPDDVQYFRIFQSSVRTRKGF